MRRKFSNREKAMLLVLAVLLVICLYYLAVHQPTTATIEDASARKATAQDSLTVQSALLAKMNAMQKELDALDDSERVTVPDYNNLNNVSDFLFKVAMKDTQDYTISFSKVTYSGKIVSRTVSIAFKTSDYKHAKNVIDTIANGPYRAEITSCAVTRSDIKGAITNGIVSVNLTVTFFEFDADAPSK